MGTNRIGGTLNKCYQISQDYNSYYWDVDEVECDDIYKSALRYEHLSSKSIKSINKALQEHWEKIRLINEGSTFFPTKSSATSTKLCPHVSINKFYLARDFF